jgi:hypothetical protein
MSKHEAKSEAVTTPLDSAGNGDGSTHALSRRGFFKRVGATGLAAAAAPLSTTLKASAATP